MLVVSLLANVALIGSASTRRPHSPAAMNPAPALNAASPAQGIGLPASSDGAYCSDSVLRGPVTGSASGLLRPPHRRTLGHRRPPTLAKTTVYPCRAAAASS